MLVIDGIEIILFLLFQEWVYYLNRGSQLNITYSVSSLSSSSLILVIAQGTYLKSTGYLKHALSGCLS